jgi:hypothetical protein
VSEITSDDAKHGRDAAITKLQTHSAKKEICPMLKKFSLAIAFVAVMSVRVMADDSIELGAADVASISDVDNTVVEVNVDVDLDGVAKGTDKEEVAIEACCRRWGGGGYGCGYNYGCYSSCYSPCYSYSYCYQPTYFCYRPVTYYAPCYTTYTTTCYNTCYSYPLSYWGCY